MGSQSRKSLPKTFGHVYRTLMAVNESLRLRTRHALLDAAVDTFRKKGFDDSSVEDIATRADMTRATAYNHFSSKEEIAVAAAERFRADGYARLLDRQEQGMNALELLLGFFDDAGVWIADNKQVAFVGTVAALKGVGRELDRPGTTAVFKKLVAQGQVEGSFRTDLPADHIARALTALLNQAALTDPGLSRSERRAWPRKLFMTMLEGIAQNNAPGVVPGDPPKRETQL